MTTTPRNLVKAAFGAALGIATGWLVVESNPNVLPHHPNVLDLVAGIVGAGAGLPYLLSAALSLWRHPDDSIRGSLKNVADSVRETIVVRDVGLSLRDVGVHIWVIRRRLWPPWRSTRRLARSAWSYRVPNPAHDVFRQHWRTGRAPKTIGKAWETEKFCPIDMVPEILGAWRGLTEESTIRRLRLSSDFSAIWVFPTQSPKGRLNGFIGVNVEAERLSGHTLLEAANAEQVIHDAAALAGRFISPDE